MLQTFKKRIKNEKGLSLVELLAVIVILAIIAAIAIPAIGNIIANSKAKAEVADAIQILNSAKMYELDGNVLPFESGKDYVVNYVDVSDRITEFKVEKTNSEYQVSFTGKQLGKKGPYTLAQLSKLEVSKGEIANASAETPKENP